MFLANVSKSLHTPGLLYKIPTKYMEVGSCNMAEGEGMSMSINVSARHIGGCLCFKALDML